MSEEEEINRSADNGQQFTDESQQSGKLPQEADVKPESPLLAEGLDHLAIVNDQPQTKNLNPDNNREPTQEMEVHHHPDLHHRPRKWKEYFFRVHHDLPCSYYGFFCRELPRTFGRKQKRERNYFRAL